MEEDSFTMHEEATRLQNEASVLAERLQAVLHDKFRPLHHNFDAETPIDKALNFLSHVISVQATACHCTLHQCEEVAGSACVLECVQRNFRCAQNLSIYISCVCLCLMCLSLLLSLHSQPVCKHIQTEPL